MKILLLNGPNLNLLGRRKADIYGGESFEDILESLRLDFPAAEILYFQSNHEGGLIDRLHQSLNESLDGLVINAGALTHYSYALRDALEILSIPKVEVHISHIFSREAFRHTSVISPVCHGMISGMGRDGYRLALLWLQKRVGDG